MNYYFILIYKLKNLIFFLRLKKKIKSIGIAGENKSKSCRNKIELQLMCFPVFFLRRKSSSGDGFVVDSDLLALCVF